MIQEDPSQLYYFGQRILQIIQPLAVGSDRRQILASLARSVADNFAADGCWLVHYPSHQTMDLVANYTYNHLTAAWGAALAGKKPPSAPEPIEWRQPLLAGYQVMVVDTYDRHQVNGSLIVATKGVTWYPETKLVLQIVAQYISTALSLAEMNQQAQIARVYPALYQHLIRAIIENQDVDTLFRIAVEDMLTALQLQRGMVLSLRANERSQLNPASNNTQVQILTAIEARTGSIDNLPRSFALHNSAYCQQALKEVPAATVIDRSKHSTPTDREIFDSDRLPNIVMIPLMGTSNTNRDPSSAIWGWLVLQGNQPRQWFPVELELLCCTIYQIALARIQKQALRQVQNVVANRTAQVQTSLQLQSKLHEAGRKQMEKLRHNNHLKDEFVSTVSHELRTPLTSMSMAIKMLRQPDLDPDRQQRYLDILDEECQREIKLVNNLLTLQQLESQQLEIHPQKIDLNHFIEEKVAQVSQNWSDKKQLKVDLDLPVTSPYLETDVDSFSRIMEELLLNAGKFALPHTIVEIRANNDPEQTTLQITNLSKPIPAADLPYLFTKFHRAEGTTKQAIAGTGLGLALVKSLVEHLHGQISVTSDLLDATSTDTDSSTPATTSFTVTIPNMLDPARI